MKPTWGARIVAAAVMGLGFGCYMHHDYTRWHQLGQIAYMAHQSQRFDKYMASPRPLMVTAVGAMIAVGIFLALYESVALVGGKMFAKRESNN